MLGEIKSLGRFPDNPHQHANRRRRRGHRVHRDTFPYATHLRRTECARSRVHSTYVSGSVLRVFVCAAILMQRMPKLWRTVEASGCRYVCAARGYLRNVNACIHTCEPFGKSVCLAEFQTHGKYWFTFTCVETCMAAIIMMFVCGWMLSLTYGIRKLINIRLHKRLLCDSGDTTRQHL